MTNEIIRVQDGEKKPAETTAPEQKDFKGYSLEDLRYQRALVALRKDFAKSKMIHNIDKARKHRLGGESGSSKIARAGGIAAKLFSGLSYLDYAMLGMSLFSSGRKIYSFFRGKKR